MRPELGVVRELAAQPRTHSSRCSSAAGPGRTSPNLSAADLMAVPPARHLRYDWTPPDGPRNDHLDAVVLEEALAGAPSPPSRVQPAVKSLPGSDSSSQVVDAVRITPPHMVAAALRLAGTP